MYAGNYHEYTYASIDGSSTAFHGYAPQHPNYQYQAQQQTPPAYHSSHQYQHPRTNMSTSTSVPPPSSVLQEGEEMTVDHLLDNDLQYALVLDTNILMDHLTLLDDLFPQIRHNDLKLALMVPRVVINELDNLKTNGGSQEKRFKAQNANRWLATQMQPGQRYLRGQKSTKVPSGRLSGEKGNDDLIIEYCKEVQQITLPLGGRVTLLTNDHNCRARAQSTGIPALELKNLTRPLEVLTPCVGSLLKLTEDRSANSSRWAPSNSSEPSPSHLSRRSTAPQYRLPGRQRHEPTAAYHSDPDWMDVEDIDMSPPRSADPLTILHDEFVETMATGFRAYIQSQAKAKEHEITPSKSAVRTGGSWDSMHAPKPSASPLTETKQPHPAEVETWTCAECIDHILNEADTSTGNRTSRAMRNKPDVVLAKQLVSRAGNGGRKGSEWTLGGWKVGLDQLKGLAVYCGIEGLDLQVDVWRARVSAAFERG